MHDRQDASDPSSNDARQFVDQLRRPLDQLPDPLPIPTLRSAGTARFDVTITPPGSKSLTNRALLLALLAEGTTTLREPLLEADDAQRMLQAIATLGGRVETQDRVTRITGVNGAFCPPAEPVFLNNAGTATRFLAAASMLATAPLTLDGNERMRQRPIHQLAEALEQLGVGHAYLQDAGCPPITLTPPSGWESSPSVRFDTLPSSQFVSGLLLVAPFTPSGLSARINCEVTSRPYIKMTLALLDRVGARVTASDDLKQIHVQGSADRARGIDPFDLLIEPDASGATYWHTAAAICPGSRVCVPGLEDSLQGDALFPALLQQMGAQVTEDHAKTTGNDSIDPISADMASMPDAAMSLAVAASFGRGSTTTTMTGLETLRVKETDRIAAMHAELSKIGIDIEMPTPDDPGRMRFTTPRDGLDLSDDAPEVHFDTYDDHRMAMSLALIGLRRPNVLINDPKCVAKTYPTFFQDLARLYG